MKTRQLLTLTCVAVVASAIAIGWHRVAGKSTEAYAAEKEAPIAPKDSPVQQTGVPKHIAYGLFFGEMLAFKKKAEERERSGLDGSWFRKHHEESVALNERQRKALELIAADCNATVLGINDKARRIINRDRARHPHGKLREGKTLPIPPPELKYLEEERTATILEAREKLRSAFGEEEFRRLDDFIQEDIASRVKTVPRLSHRP